MFRQSGSRTRVAHAFARTPLRLLLPRNHGHAAWAYVTSFGGGMLGGDELSLRMEVERGAAAFVSTQGPTRVFRAGTRGSRNAFDAHIEDDGLLAHLPDPLALFAGARLVQTTKLTLAPRANLIWSDLLSAGRVARGERWALASLDSTLRLELAGEPLIHERTLLDGTHGLLRERMRRFDALATLVVVGPRVQPLVERLSARIRDEPVSPRAQLLTSVSPVRGGVLARFAATSTELLVRRMHAELRILHEWLGDDPLARRV